MNTSTLCQPDLKTKRSAPFGAMAVGALAALMTCTISTAASAQPASFEGIQLPLDAVESISVPGPNYALLKAEDERNDFKAGPMRIAVPNDVSITPNTHGTWETMPNGRLLWRLIVEAPGSKHLNVAFQDWQLPRSGEAWIASTNGRTILNRITSADNINDGELWSALVFSDSAIIEISIEPEDRAELVENTTLTRINAGYRGFGVDETRGFSESCNIDVACPLGDEWQDEIPAAAVYTINGTSTCSGSMINNTANDQTPYFFTADHCGLTSGNDQSIVVYWNHENTTCRTGEESGNDGDGNFNQYTSGSTYLSGDEETDFTLIQLNSDPSPSYKVTFAGWSRSSSTPCLGVSIHHPNGAEKRISSAEIVYSFGTLWGVNWDQGRTSSGSSGSPLFNCNHQIVGSLCCGEAFCTNDLDDFYGQSLFQSWSLMSEYLDPVGSNAISCDTFNPYTFSSGACCLEELCYPVSARACQDAEGQWKPDEICDASICVNASVGACCTNNGCQLTSSVDCSYFGGEWLGANSNCLLADCSNCIGDADGSGGVDVNDILITIGEYGVLCP